MTVQRVFWEVDGPWWERRLDEEPGQDGNLLYKENWQEFPPQKKDLHLAGPFPIPVILTDDTPWDTSDSNGGPTDRK